MHAIEFIRRCQAAIRLRFQKKQFHVLTGRRGRRNSSELGWRVVWLWSTHQNGHAEATECRRLFLASTVQLLKRLDEYTRGFVWSCSSDLHRSVCSSDSEWWSIILGWWWSSASGRERRVFILGVLLIGSFIDSFVLSASYYYSEEPRHK